MAGDTGGDSAGVGIPVPGNAVRVPLLETGHEPNISSDRAPNSGDRIEWR